MNVIAVDDEQFALKSIERTLKKALPNANLSCFNNPMDSIEYAKSNRVDVAFLDIEMGGMNGLQLAKALKDVYGDTNIIFVTGFTKYAIDAFTLHASGYILKPVEIESIVEAMEWLNRPIVIATDKKLRVQTFGNFEAFVNDVPLTFARTKTKELLAYLILRNGALCSNNEIISVLWEDKPDSENLKSHFRHLVSDLTMTLTAAEVDDVLFKQRGALSILTDKFECDMFDFCVGKNVNKYRGEFMAQYSWAEFENGFLQRNFL